MGRTFWAGAAMTIDLAEIRNGLAQNEFFLEYLPTISLADGHCIGAEALIRWRKNGVVIPPIQFVPITERTPVSGLITYWVIERVMGELGDWLAQNRDGHIAINVPPELLGRGALAYAASKSGLIAHGSQILLEITERGIPDALGVDALNERAGLGARVALDDVTLVSGANLAVFARCHFDAIKLDKSLIDQIVDDAPVPAWLRTLSALLEISPFQVIAEGVETEAQALALRTMKIQAAQGFYFSRPIPAEQFVAFHRLHGKPAGISH